MKQFLLVCSTVFCVGTAFADDYISFNNYIQNPNNGQPSGGGTHMTSESQMAEQGVWQTLFTDGTYNVQAVSSFAMLNGANQFGYGANIFGQTGSIAGFSAGGNLTIMNPYLPNYTNGPLVSQYQFLPTNQVIFPSQLFVEYKVPNVFQADVGWLYINTPWVTSVNPLTMQSPTFQGAMFNLQLTQDLLLTGLALNGYMPSSAEGFSGFTMYNRSFDFSTDTPNINGAASPGTLAIGAQYGANTSDAWKSNLWLYQFQDYASMLYADTKYTWTINPSASFTFAAQAANEGTMGASYGSTNVFVANGDGAPQSNLLGGQVGFTYDWFNFTASYDSVFGNNTGYEGGGLVSPYTYQLGTDPLYTTGFIAGLVEKSAGDAIKLTPTATFFNNSLSFSPSWEQYNTSPYPSSTEWDMTVNYAVSAVKGLSFSGGYGYLQQPWSVGGTVQLGQVMVSYVY